MVNRRDFLAFTGATTAGGLTGCRESVLHRDEGTTQRQRRPVKMHVGTQRLEPTPEAMQFAKRHAVNHACVEPLGLGDRGYWTLEEIERTRDLCARYGVSMDSMHLRFLWSNHISLKMRPAIMLGQSPERDRDIELVHKTIESLAKAGIPQFMYNLNLLGGMKGGTSEPLRGGAMSRVWRMKDADETPRLTRAGRVTEEMFWERITYFLDRVIPVCDEYKIRAACHPHDPPGPPGGFQGIVRVLGTPEGLKRLVSIQESPYHGLNLCLGSTAEMLRNPNEEIHEIIRYFGERKKIFNIHFRNIRGGLHDFQETFPDNGDMDMARVALTLYEVGYEGMLMPDHIPTHPDDPNGWQALAFCYGYIKGVLQSLETLA